MDDPLPHYQRLKAFVTGEIEAGRLRPGHRIPSELDLMRRFSVSRMTANWALRELQQAGVVMRVQGLGSFVPRRKTEQAMFDVNNIACAVRSSGQDYACRVIHLAAESAQEIRSLMGLGTGNVTAGLRCYTSPMVCRFSMRTVARISLSRLHFWIRISHASHPMSI